MKSLVPDNDQIFKYDVDVVKKDDTTFIVKGKVDQLKDIEENMKIEIKLYHGKDGEELKEIMKKERPVCEFMKGPYKTFIYPKFEKTSNIPKPEKCPVPKENYVINETEFDANKFKKFSMPGKWKIEARLMQEDKIISGIVMEGSVKVKE